MTATRTRVGFWEYTKRSAADATAEFFRPLVAFKSAEHKGGQSEEQRRLSHAAKAVQAEVQTEIDGARAQWEEFVEGGKSLIVEHGRVTRGGPPSEKMPGRPTKAR